MQAWWIRLGAYHAALSGSHFRAISAAICPIPCCCSPVRCCLEFRCLCFNSAPSAAQKVKLTPPPSTAARSCRLRGDAVSAAANIKPPTPKGSAITPGFIRVESELTSVHVCFFPASPRQPERRPAFFRAVGAIDAEGSAASRRCRGGCDDGERT